MIAVNVGIAAGNIQHVFEEDELNPVAALLGIIETEFKDMYIKGNYGEYQLRDTEIKILYQ